MLAGGPFWCAQDDLAVALTSCMVAGEMIDVPFLAGIAQAAAVDGFLDPLANLAHSRVWLFSGTNDTVVDVSVVQAAEALYKGFLADPGTQMTALYSLPGEHSQQTVAWGSPCDYLGSPYINACGYDAAGAMLQWLYNGSLAAPGANATGNAANLYAFDQAAFIGGGAWSPTFGLAQEGFVYVPPACLAGAGGSRGEGGSTSPSCKLHVALHGCEQSQDDIGFDYMLNGGYLPWADANGIVVLFAQAQSNLFNPKSCWDWWGYTGPAYASNVGTQTLVIKQMTDVLLGLPLTANRTLAPNETAGGAGWPFAPVGGMGVAAMRAQTHAGA
jgi:hypothetical protein